MRRRSPEEYIAKDKQILTDEISILTKKRDALKKEYESERDMLFEQGEKDKKFLNGVVGTLQNQVVSLQNQISELEVRKEELDGKITERENLLEELTKRHGKISKELFENLMKKQGEIDVATKELAALNTQCEIVKKSIADLLALRNSTQIEFEGIIDDKNATQNEIEELKEKRSGVIAEIESKEGELEENRKIVLENKDMKKILSIELHDVRVLRLRLQPEFQDKLRSYLQK